ncbi:SURF1 family protein [Thiohalomonas denitrificans]|uniref:SURF1-like protein n=1 Tax=Thiohalomonas denitrificans TaxID=415747 RepID=A0A1G5PX00_9GAMM|nr:SURF1 family protein [Thiohalomonas denitrificans]SCZ53569.1 surfeit locus 1 family protein [Thiohalomonas denitrificans]
MRALIGIGVVLLSALCLQLGFWQLHRAEEAEVRSAMVREQANREPVFIKGVETAGAELFYRRALARGRFEMKHRFWVEGRRPDGRQGLQYIVPLHIAGSELRVLVNRGWVARPETSVTRARQPAEIEGLLVRPAVPTLQLTDSNKAFGDRWPYLDPERYARSHNVAVAPFVLVEDSRLAGELLKAELGRADKRGMHIGYALQWFAFAVLLLLFLAVLGKNRQRETP